MTTDQKLNCIGLIINVIGSLLLLVDSNRLFKNMIFLVQKMAETHGKYDSRKFTQEDLNNLTKAVTASKTLNLLGILFLLIGFSLQLVAFFAAVPTLTQSH